MASTAEPFTVTTWTDYLCPWAYLGRPHTQWLRDQGVGVRIRGYELHPDVPPEGRPIRPGGSYDRLLDRLADEGRGAGLAFNKPDRTPNTRRALELLDLVDHHQPEVALAFDTALATAVWVDHEPIDDAAVLDRLATRAGVDRMVLERLDSGEGASLLDTGRVEAHEIDVSATPSWRIGALTISGVHDDEQFHRWAHKLIARHHAAGPHATD